MPEGKRKGVEKPQGFIHRCSLWPLFPEWHCALSFSELLWLHTLVAQWALFVQGLSPLGGQDTIGCYKALIAIQCSVCALKAVLYRQPQCNRKEGVWEGNEPSHASSGLQPVCGCVSPSEGSWDLLAASALGGSCVSAGPWCPAWSSEPAWSSPSARWSMAVLIASLWVFVSSTGQPGSEGPHPLWKQHNMKSSVISCAVTHTPSGRARDWNSISRAPRIENVAHRWRFPQPTQSLYFPSVKYLALAAWIWIRSSSCKLAVYNY